MEERFYYNNSTWFRRYGFRGGRGRGCPLSTSVLPSIRGRGYGPCGPPVRRGRRPSRGPFGRNDAGLEQQNASTTTVNKVDTTRPPALEGQREISQEEKSSATRRQPDSSGKSDEIPLKKRKKEVHAAEAAVVEKEQELKARDEFRALMENAIMHKSDFTSKFGEDKRFKNIENVQERENLFNKYILEVQRKEEKVTKQEREQDQNVTTVPTAANTDALVSATNAAAIKERPTGNAGIGGTFYQSHLLMIFLLNGKSKGFNFKLYTEITEAHKFDDLIFDIITDNGSIFRCFQVKHRINSNKKIPFRELLSDKQSAYDIVKFYFSYIDMKKEAIFRKGIIKNVAFFTNINFEMDDEKLRTYLKELIKTYKLPVDGVETLTVQDMIQDVPALDDIDLLNVYFFKKAGRCYKFTEHIVKFLKPLLHNYNLVRLAGQVVQCLLSEEDNKDFDLFRFYSCVLARKVFDAQSGTFLKNFIIGKNLDKTTYKFRSAVMQELSKSKEKLGLKEINMELKYIKKIKLVILQKVNDINNNDDWPDNVITNEEIEDFLNHLIFAVDQPDNDELENVIRTYFHGYFKNWGIVDSVYNKLCVKMMKWIAGKEDDYISNETMKSWIEPETTVVSISHPQGLLINLYSTWPNSGRKNGEPAELSDRLKGYVSFFRYELHLQMLFLLYGLENKYSFKLACLLSIDSNFYNLLFKNESNRTISFMQVIIQDKEFPIKLVNLFNVDRVYNFYSYYRSYQLLKKEKMFISYDVHDVTVFTNTALNLNEEYIPSGSHEKVKMSDVVQKIDLPFHVACRYQFTERLASILKSFLEDTTKLKVKDLANRLAKSLLRSADVDHQDFMFKHYHIILATKVIDVKSRKLREEFVNGINLDARTKYFRTLLENEIIEISQNTVNLATINQEISNKENKNINLILSDGFGEGTDDTWEDYTYKDIQDFLKHFVVAVNQPTVVELTDIIKNKLKNLYSNFDEIYLYNNLLIESGNRFRSIITEESAMTMMKNITATIKFAVKAPMDNLIGRENELRDLIILEENMRNSADILKLIWISGPSRIGKTEFVRKYAHEYWLKFNKNVIWIDATEYSTLVDSFNKLAQKFLYIGSMQLHPLLNTHQVVEEVYLFLSNIECLFVFDNASKYTSEQEDDEGINTFLNKASRNHFFLATSTRTYDDQPSINIFPLNSISEDDMEKYKRKQKEQILAEEIYQSEFYKRI